MKKGQKRSLYTSEVEKQGKRVRKAAKLALDSEDVTGDLGLLVSKQDKVKWRRRPKGR